MKDDWNSIKSPPTEAQIDINACVSFVGIDEQVVIGFQWEGNFNLDGWCFEFENPFIEYWMYLPKPPIHIQYGLNVHKRLQKLLIQDVEDTRND